MDQDEVGKREQIQAENSQETAPHVGSQTNAKRDGRWLAIITAVMTTVMAIATAVYAYYSYGLWKSTKETAEMTRDMFKATNRPYVGIVGQDIVNDEDNKAIIITLSIKNSGNIPASNVSIHSKTHFSERIDHDKNTFSVFIRKTNFKDVYSSTSYVSPVVIYPNHSTETVILIQGESYSKVSEKQYVLLIETEIRYKGIIEGCHSTRQTWGYNDILQKLIYQGGTYK